MRIFTRELDQSINIGGSIRVKVVEVRGGQVRLGVNAAREVHIVRGEIAGTSSGRPPQRTVRGEP